MTYSPGDRVKVRRGSRWLACEVMGRVNATEDERWWVRREDTGTRISAPPSAMQAVERPARKLPPYVHIPTDPAHERRIDALIASRAARTNPLPAPHPKPQKAARSPSYLAWVRTFPCLCGCGETPVEAHHFGPRAKGTKASDFRAVPLSVRCHRGFHDTGSLPCFREARVPEPRVHTERAFYEAQARLLIEWLDIVQERKARRG